MKKILMLLAFAGVASVASAQQTMTVTEYEVIQVQDKYQVITNPFWSNWFFSVGAAPRCYMETMTISANSETVLLLHLTCLSANG